MKNLYTFWSNILIVTLLASGCKIANFEEAVTPNLPKEGTVSYPLLYPAEPGFGGSILFEKLSDGTTNSVLTIQGLNKNNRYFGKIASSNSTDFANSKTIADLGEINPFTGTKISWIREDYNNKPIYYDSLTNADAQVVIIELDPENSISKPVIRGDIGSNVILDGEKTFIFSPLNNSGISGTVKFQLRKNGNSFIETRIQGLPNQSNLEMSLFTGDHESDVFPLNITDQKNALNNYSGNQTVVYSSLSSIRSLDILDTLRGFIGIKAPITEGAKAVSFLGIANLGGNISTGRKISIPIADSLLRAELTFEEFCALSPRIRMEYKSIKIPKTGFFIYFKEDNALEEKTGTALSSFPISDTTYFIINDPKLNKGNKMSFSELDNWDAHIQIAQESFSNSLLKFDIGINEILKDDSIVVNFGLDPLNTTYEDLYSGKIKLFKRKSGKIISDIKMKSSIFGEDNIISLKKGPRPLTYEVLDTTETIFNIANFLGNGSFVEIKKNLKLNNGTNILWSDLKLKTTEGAYMEYNFRIVDGEERYYYILNRGFFN